MSWLLVILLSARAEPVTSSTTSSSALPQYSWFTGHWGACSGPCGAFQTQDRDVWCQVTCSVWICNQVADVECLALYGANSKPASTGTCNIMTPCPTSTTATTSTKRPTTKTTATTTTKASTQIQSTTSITGGGSNNYRCVVILGQTQTNCLTNGAAFCGAGCPCCKLAPSPSPPVTNTQQTAAAPSPGSDGSSAVFIIILVLAVLAAIVIACGCVYCFWSARARDKKLARMGHVAQTPFTKKTMVNEAKPHDTWQGNTERNGTPARDAWSAGFEQPPEVKETFRDIPRKPGEGGTKTWFDDEDDSTDDSEHHSENAFDYSEKRSMHSARSAGKHVRSESSKTKRAQTMTTGDGDAEPSRTKRAQTLSSADSDSHPDGPNLPNFTSTRTATSIPSAAEKAFDKAQTSGKRRNRGTSRSSPHPKGTAVPPRTRDSDTSPSGSPSPERAGSKGTGQGQRPSSSPSTTQAESSHGAKTSRGTTPQSSGSPNTADAPQSDNKVASADEGVSTQVNELIQQLDAELDANKNKDIEWKRRHFKELLLKWHPDKNTNGMGTAETSAQANEVFKHLLARRNRYLES